MYVWGSASRTADPSIVPRPTRACDSRERIRIPSSDASRSTTRNPALWRVSS